MLVSSSLLDFSVPLFSRGVSLLAGGEVVDLSDVAVTYSDDGNSSAVSGYGRITRGLTSLNCIVVHDGWSDEAFINYDFQGFMDKNGVFM